jgi:hypothetical protein
MEEEAWKAKLGDEVIGNDPGEEDQESRSLPKSRSMEIL